MPSQKFSLQQKGRVFFAILASLIGLNLISCARPEVAEHEPDPIVFRWVTVTPVIAAEATPAPAIAPIQAGLESANPALIQAAQTLTDTEPVELPPVRLPMQNVEALEAAAQANDIIFAPLARERTLLYALPQNEGGLVFMLTPPETAPDFSTKELAADPSRFSNRMLGGLSVVRQIDGRLPALPAGDYVITVSATGSEVIFSDQGRAKFSFPAVIRFLPRYNTNYPPFAVITSEQMCLSWLVSQVCAVMETSLPSNWIEDLQIAATNLLGEDGQQYFLFNSSVPDIAGITALQRCEAALNPSYEETPLPPNYAGCWATLTMAPAVPEGFPIQSAIREEPGTISTMGIGLFAVLEPLEDMVFCNDSRKVLATGECIESVDPYASPTPVTSPQVPPGQYLVYHVTSETDPPVNEEVTATRIVLFTLPYISYVMPSFDGVTVIGRPVPGEDSLRTDQVGIAVNIRNRFCTFWECRWLPRRGGWWGRWWR